jgi:hypothetical protein
MLAPFREPASHEWTYLIGVRGELGHTLNDGGYAASLSMAVCENAPNSDPTSIRINRLISLENEC